MLKKIISIAVLTIVIQSLVFGMQPVQVKASDSASGFTLSDVNGKSVSLSDFQGKPVVLFFWTTWCPHCRREIKSLNQNRESLEKSGLAVLSINVGENKSKVESFMLSNQITSGVLMDKEASVAESYKIIGIPTFILIDRKGQIVSRGHQFPQEYKNLL